MSDDTPGLRAPRVTTTVTLRRDVWQKLRDMAEDAALRDGGKPSASAIIETLVKSVAST